MAGLFSSLASAFGPKKQIEKVHSQYYIAHAIVIQSLQYQVKAYAETKNSEDAFVAGFEMMYFLLHEVDRWSFDVFGKEKRIPFSKEIDQIAIDAYAGAVIKTQEDKDEIIKDGAFALNARHRIYGQCDQLMSKYGPTTGTRMFALCYLINSEIAEVETSISEDMLIGKVPIDDFLPRKIDHMIIVLDAIDSLAAAKFMFNIAIADGVTKARLESALRTLLEDGRRAQNGLDRKPLNEYTMADFLIPRLTPEQTKAVQDKANELHSALRKISENERQE